MLRGKKYALLFLKLFMRMAEMMEELWLSFTGGKEKIDERKRGDRRRVEEDS